MTAHDHARREFLLSAARFTAMLQLRLGDDLFELRPMTPASWTGRDAEAESRRVSDRVDQYVNAEMQRRGMIGMGLAVVHRGQLVKVGAYGIANLEHRVATTPHTRFHLDSLSKVFTAVAIMQLVEAGVLRLEDPVSRWLENTQPSWSGVTIRHLLSHSSGIVDDYAEEFQGSMLVRYSPEALYEHARTRPLEFKPGELARYNNLGFFLATLVVERASGVKFPQYIEQRILAPIGMSESAWQAAQDVVPDLAEPYVRSDGRVVHMRGYMASQAGFSYAGVATPADMGRFVIALERGRLLKQSSIAEMEKPFVLNDGTNARVGLAWDLGAYRGYRTLSKPGASGSLLMRIPERHIAVAVLGNIEGDWPVSYPTLAHGVAGFYDDALSPRSAVDRVSDGLLHHRIGDAIAELARPTSQPRVVNKHWIESYPAEEAAGIAGFLAGVETFEVTGCDDLARSGWRPYGVRVRRTCSVSVKLRGSPIPLALTFHLGEANEVAMIELE